MTSESLLGGDCEYSSAEAAVQLPTETEIYVLPDGQIVVADLPEELMSLLMLDGTHQS